MGSGHIWSIDPEKEALSPPIVGVSIEKVIWHFESKPTHSIVLYSELIGTSNDM